MEKTIGHDDKSYMDSLVTLYLSFVRLGHPIKAHKALSETHTEVSGFHSKFKEIMGTVEAGGGKGFHLAELTPVGPRLRRLVRYTKEVHEMAMARCSIQDAYTAGELAYQIELCPHAG